MAYKYYLKSKHWKNKKRQYYNKRTYRCYFCKKKFGLQLHHITYENIGKENIEDLVYLCSSCHNYLHKGYEKEKVQNWLKRIRLKNIKKVKKYGENWRCHKKTGLQKKYRNDKCFGYLKKRNKTDRYKKTKRSKMKKYAGLFTWKAEETKLL